MLGRRSRPVEIPYQADSDAVLVVVVVRSLAVGTVLLLVPARSNLDESIWSSRSVSDDEVVAQLVPAILLTVVLVESLRSAAFCPAVMDHDRRPS